MLNDGTTLNADQPMHVPTNLISDLSKKPGRKNAVFGIFFFTLTDGHTDIRTDGQTDPLKEMRGLI